MIITDEQKLRVVCKDVLPEEIGPLKDQLERELERSASIGRPGVGLSAPQIGINKNMAIIRSGQGVDIDLVNAKIIKGYDKHTFNNEGCLSFPGKFVKTKRYNEIYISNNLVEPESFILTGFPAIIVQHELDHLNGVLLPDVEIKEEIKKKIRPNDPCACGSNKKYKKCCKLKDGK